MAPYPFSRLHIEKPLSYQDGLISQFFQANRCHFARNLASWYIFNRLNLLKKTPQEWGVLVYETFLPVNVKTGCSRSIYRHKCCNCYRVSRCDRCRCKHGNRIDGCLQSNGPYGPRGIVDASNLMASRWWRNRIKGLYSLATPKISLS